MLNWPPMRSAPSNSTTPWPRSASVVAAARPAGPAPTTAKRRGVAAGVILSSVSKPARGFTRQVAWMFLKVWSRQAWLQAMQVLISSARPCAAFSMNAGSARKGRASDTMSAWP